VVGTLYWVIHFCSRQYGPTIITIVDDNKIWWDVKDNLMFSFKERPICICIELPCYNKAG
jgi:hypothetical protein